MTSELWWNNLTAWSLQVAALVAMGALLPWLFRLRSPAARLACWQVLLAACAALPLVQPWNRPVILVSTAAGGVPPAGEKAAPPVSLPRFRWKEAALPAAASGAALRLLWLGLGLLRLRRYRRNARLLYPLPLPLQRVRDSLGAESVVCISGEISGPVTFGAWPPVVLLPARVLALPDSAQEAIVCHELLHVRRRDWVFSICEEVAGAFLWFHPAVWWLLGRIRLSREQVVDHEVVRRMQARDKYVEALLQIAGSGARLDLTPALLFLRRRHLIERVGSLFTEVSMSRRHLIGSLASALLVLALVGWVCVRSFPLRAAPQVKEAAQEDTPGVTVDHGSLRLLHRTPVEYPLEAQQERVEGAVVLELSVNAEGMVWDARVISGPEELRRGALESVLRWHYTNETKAPARAQITIHFRAPESAPPERELRTEAAAPPPASPQIYTTEPAIRKIDVDSLPEPLRETVRSRTARFEGRPFTPELMREIALEVSAVDRHLWSIVRGGDIIIRLAEPGAESVQRVLSSASFPPPASGTMRVRVGGGVQARKLIDAKPPDYPPLAKQARLQGTVRFDALIGADGHVKNLTAASGHPLLVPAAMEAVRSWVYQPTLLNGKPVEVITQVEVNFSLSGETI